MRVEIAPEANRCMELAVEELWHRQRGAVSSVYEAPSAAPAKDVGIRTEEKDGNRQWQESRYARHPVYDVVGEKDDIGRTETTVRADNDKWGRSQE